MTESSPSRRRVPAWIVLLSMSVIAVFAIIVVIIFAQSSGASLSQTEPISAESYLDEIAALPEGDPINGDKLIDSLDCGACHRIGGERVAPPFAGIAERAESRRPPLTGPAYIYEAIMRPSAYVVESYIDAMPQNYPARLSPQEIADLLAYLLTEDAK